MVYSLRTKNMSPEIYRSRTLYSAEEFSFLTKDHSHANSGMSWSAARKVFDNLENAEMVSYVADMGEGAAYVGTSPSNMEKRTVSPVDDNFFKVFSFRFIVGSPFSREQLDAGAKVIIITDKMAKTLFGSSEDAIGKTVLVRFMDYRVIGVVKSVSTIFNNAYSDAWIPAPHEMMDYGAKHSEGLRGQCKAIVVAKKGVPMQVLKDEIDGRVKALNDGLREYTFEVKFFTHPEKSFFSGAIDNPFKIFALLILVLLIVPAINMTGLLSTQMKKRSSEIGVRKAYGASQFQLTKQLVVENLMFTIVGGVLGLLLSFTAIFIFKNTLMSDMFSMIAGGEIELPLSYFFSPWLYVLMLIFCVMINLLSAIIPAWNASRTSIIETIKGE